MVSCLQNLTLKFFTSKLGSWVEEGKKECIASKREDYSMCQRVCRWHLSKLETMHIDLKRCGMCHNFTSVKLHP